MPDNSTYTPAQILPSIGAQGVFRLKAPYDTLLTPGVSYQCLSIRKLSDIIGEGKDPLALYYSPYTVSQVIYGDDLIKGVSIVGLQSGSGDWVYVPSSFIASYPNGSGVPYTCMMIGVSLGAIPDEVSLAGLQSVLESTCLDVLGVIAKTNVVAVSKTQLIDDAQHETLETVRINRTTTDASSAVYIARLQNDVLVANSKVQALESYIVAQNLVSAMSLSSSISTSQSLSLSTTLSLSTSVSQSVSSSTSTSQSLSTSLSTGQ